MITLPDKPTVYFDVDGTLVSPVSGGENVRDCVFLGALWWKVNKEHVALLKQFSSRGHTVVVWSQGGSEWAERVVRGLGIVKEVNACMPKPHWYVDDLPAEKWVPERVFLKEVPC